MALPRFAPDHFTLALVGTVVLASLLPASGPMARVLEVGRDVVDVDGSIPSAPTKIQG